jgi:hypothetical protein
MSLPDIYTGKWEGEKQLYEFHKASISVWSSGHELLLLGAASASGSFEVEGEVVERREEL